MTVTVGGESTGFQAILIPLVGLKILHCTQEGFRILAEKDIDLGISLAFGLSVQTS